MLKRDNLCKDTTRFKKLQRLRIDVKGDGPNVERGDQRRYYGPGL